MFSWYLQYILIQAKLKNEKEGRVQNKPKSATYSTHEKSRVLSELIL